MSTRYYFGRRRSSVVVGVAVTPDASWEHQTSFDVGILTPDPTNLGVAVPETRARGATTTVNPADVLHSQLVSEPLAAGTLSGTFSLVALLSEGAADDDMMLQVIIRVVSGNGTVVRGVAYAGQTNTTVTGTNTAVNFELGLTSAGVRTRYFDGVSLSSVGIQAGDRIVVELGARSVAAASAVNVSMQHNDREEGEDFELVADQAQVATPPYLRPWIEFSADLYPTLLREEFRFQYTGVPLNTAVALPFVDITKVSGLDNAPVASSDNTREGMHGAYTDASYQGSRTVTLEGNIYASSAALETYLDSLKDNFRPNKEPHPLFIGTDSDLRVVFGKSLGLKYDKDPLRRLGIVPFQVQLLCSDPRIYKGPSPKVYASDGTGVNQPILVGNRDVFPVINLRGGFTSATIIIENFWGSHTLTYTGTVGTAEVVTIDVANRSVRLNYVTNVRGNLVVTDWPALSPGQNFHSCAFGSSSGTPRIWIRYQEAYE